MSLSAYLLVFLEGVGRRGWTARGLGSVNGSWLKFCDYDIWGFYGVGVILCVVFMGLMLCLYQSTFVEFEYIVFITDMKYSNVESMFHMMTS